MPARTHQPAHRDNSWRNMTIPLIYFPRKPGSMEPPEPVPFILTAEDVCRLTRIDETEVKAPEKTLERYRTQGILHGAMIGRELRYLLPDVLDFVETLKTLNPH